MSRVYVPWTERPTPQFRGLARPVAAVARLLYRALGPVVRRFPGLTFLTVLLGACVIAWVLALAIQDAWAFEAHFAHSGVARGGSVPLTGAAAWTIDQFRGATRSAGGPVQPVMPLGLVWCFQWPIVRDLVGIAGLVALVSLIPVFGIWWERKVSAHIQSRIGPMRVGGWHGWSQSFADGIKLIAKEDFVPPGGDGPLFRLAPYLAFVPSLAAFLALPFGAFWVLRDLDVALVFILAMMGIEVVSVILAGWASNNKWSLFGGMREACQVVSYEIPMGMSLLIPVMIAGSLRFTDVAALQAGGWFDWLVFHSPFAFVAAFTYFIASLASVKRAPFDLPEGESELVSGFHTEYSGFRWCLFFFAEYAAMFVVSGLAVILFGGAWHAPWSGLAPASWAESTVLWQRVVHSAFFSGPIIFVAKCLLMIYVQMWLRWTLPRIRIDQVLYACVQVMLPLAMGVLLFSALWELILSRGWPWFLALADAVRYLLGAIGLAATLAGLYVIWYGFTRRRLLVGRLATDILPGA